MNVALKIRVSRPFVKSGIGAYEVSTSKTIGYYFIPVCVSHQNTVCLQRLCVVLTAMCNIVVGYSLFVE